MSNKIFLSIFMCDDNNVKHSNAYETCLHTVPKLTPDGHKGKEMFKFGSDRKTIEPFVRAS